MMPQSFWQYDILISIAITAIGFKSHIIQLNIGYDASVLFTTSHFDYWKQSILLHLNPMSSNSTSSLKSNIGVATPDTMVFRLTTTTIYPVINCFKVNIQSIDDLKKNIIKLYKNFSVLVEDVFSLCFFWKIILGQSNFSRKKNIQGGQ